MAFQRGHQKVGGRKPSTPNKLTKSTKEALSLIVDQELSKLSKTLGNMKPVERAQVLIRLLPYVISPAQPSDETPSVQPTGTIIRWGDKEIHV